VSETILEVRGVTKSYGGLRPLRMERLDLHAGERIALVGLDGATAEVFVNLLTGASLPDQGRVALFGRDTSSISDADEWLASLDRLGIVSARAVLLDDLTIAQNIATSFTLSIDPVGDDVMAQVRGLADEIGLERLALDRRVADVPSGVVARCHLAKALALSPLLLVLEHANAIAGDGAAAFGRTIGEMMRARNLAGLVLTADDAFARAAADRVLAVSPATGELRDRSGWRRFLSGS
jgi:ABC-type transporter Mla maintaining outer membrane lipid asymmetry ATPase subunit MlaF